MCGLGRETASTAPIQERSELDEAKGDSGGGIIAIDMPTETAPPDARGETAVATMPER